jgi:DNA-binding IclR family transcriptional regulator
MASDVPAVDAAVRILERLASVAPAPVGAGQLVKELQLNRSTCYNILTTLQRAGWVTSLGERAGWTVGPRLLSLTGDAAGLVAAATQQELDRLSARLRLVVFVAEMDGSAGYTVTAKAELQTGVRVTVGIGDRFPFSAPALLHALGAWIPPESFDRLVEHHGLRAFTEYTVVDREQLHKVLESVRNDGYSRSIRQFDLSQAAVAAPVFDSRGRPYRAVCSLGFSSELNERNVEEVGQAVRACADAITLRTGGVLPAAATSAASPPGSVA